MNNACINLLCSTLKKIIAQLRSQNTPLSFVLLVGKKNQGKTTWMRQTDLELLEIDPGHDESQKIIIYYNQQGIVIELGEYWLTSQRSLLQLVLKKLNNLHYQLRISGLLFCVDINELLIAEPAEFAKSNKAHMQLLEQCGQSLGYRIDFTMVFTKLDALAGFCEFFQNEHTSDLSKPLGFSFGPSLPGQKNKLIETYTQQFNQLIEMLGQHVINKMHPARSSAKRTLIREFPLQLASLQTAIQSLLQLLPLHLFELNALYFTSAEQGGISVDRLNKKIQHEYALTIQDTFAQSNNYRAYFIQGALQAFQEQTRHYAITRQLSNKWVIGVISSVLGLSLIGIGHQYFHSSHLLDEASKELLRYETLNKQQGDHTLALYHLSQATARLEHINAGAFSLPTVQHLKHQLRNNTEQHLRGDFASHLLTEIEKVMQDSNQSHADRYHALKIYLMLGDATRFSQSEVAEWFQNHWQKNPSQDNSASNTLQNQLTLLQQTLKQPFQALTINQQIVTDARNFIKALPANYFYYSLAKSYFTQEITSTNMDGFALASASLPIYYTKPGFQQTLAQLPAIAAKLQEDNWVLDQASMDNLVNLLQEAYCYDYVTWWTGFIKKTNLMHFQDYEQAKTLLQTLNQSNGISKLLDFIVQQVGPDQNTKASLFNQQIASKFTHLNFMSKTTVRDFMQNLAELEKFFNTLAVINDNGHTAFNLTKSRFQEKRLGDPLSTLYARARQLPEPIASWAKQLADDTWALLINETKRYINEQWQQTVFRDYQNMIAKRYPFDSAEREEVKIPDFNHFFSTHGILNEFSEQYLKPFLNTSKPEWKLKEVDNFVLPISTATINELIRANIINTMFFPRRGDMSRIEFSLQKVNLDPIIANLQLSIGETTLQDDQDTESLTQFTWPQPNASLTINSIEGNHYELDEIGPWAFFKLLQKVNVIPDKHNAASLQILFEVNGNSGRYILKTQNKINPFSPGILNGFILPESIA